MTAGVHHLVRNVFVPDGTLAALSSPPLCFLCLQSSHRRSFFLLPPSARTRFVFHWSFRRLPAAWRRTAVSAAECWRTVSGDEDADADAYEAHSPAACELPCLAPSAR